MAQESLCVHLCAGNVAPACQAAQMSVCLLPSRSGAVRHHQRCGGDPHHGGVLKAHLQGDFLCLVHIVVILIINCLTCKLVVTQSAAQDELYDPYIGQLTKLGLLASAIHQAIFTIFSTLPFAVGQACMLLSLTNHPTVAGCSAAPANCQGFLTGTDLDCKVSGRPQKHVWIRGLFACMQVQDVGLIFLSAMATSIAVLCEQKGYSREEALGTSLITLAISTFLVGFFIILLGEAARGFLFRSLPVSCLAI